MPNAEKIGHLCTFRAAYMQKSATTPNCGSLSSAVTLKMRSRSKTHKIYLTCLSNMSMKKYDNDLLSLPHKVYAKRLYFAAMW